MQINLLLEMQAPKNWAKSLKSTFQVTHLCSEIFCKNEPFKPFHDRGRYHIETSPLICSANQWTGFYMITASVMKGLNVISKRFAKTEIWLLYVCKT